MPHSSQQPEAPHHPEGYTPEVYYSGMLDFVELCIIKYCASQMLYLPRDIPSGSFGNLSGGLPYLHVWDLARVLRYNS